MKASWVQFWLVASNILAGFAGHADAWKKTGNITSKWMEHAENGVDLDLVKSSHELKLKRIELDKELGLA